ncbi:hypothetical protein PMW_221 [Pseudomonas phage phiPMW]|uniref:Uncharacterized protein n=1 Tax=Pseudomonas phage phiPMW TaxID=1815582 RepID=A0A1S5R1R8_9CAUD|nr:hypothetical protein FDG97_gp129 [Pseudomonas phage phiPMW]ANA49346.1 hypothetical protein PMW_221 [Pseudomonas phage phiPMW]
MIQEFGDRVEGPADYTDRYWQRSNWGIEWTEEGDGPDDEFQYHSEARKKYETTRYMICTLDDGCGERYQAVFDLIKEVADA